MALGNLQFSFFFKIRKKNEKMKRTSTAPIQNFRKLGLPQFSWSPRLTVLELPVPITSRLQILYQIRRFSMTSKKKKSSDAVAAHDVILVQRSPIFEDQAVIWG